MGPFIDKTLETFQMVANAIDDLRRRVEALEKKSPLTEVVDQSMPVHRTLDESDRSHVISIGESHYHL